MHSIGHFILEQDPDKKVLYVTSEEFTNEVIESIRSGNAASDYTVNSAYTCKEFEGYTPAEGNKLLVAELTVKNTDRSTVTMYDTDFQIQWGDDDDDDAFDAPITYYSDAVSDDQLPEEYDLSVNEERTGLLVFEVPEDSKDYSISYLEQFSNETKGDVFFVYFTAKDK